MSRGVPEGEPVVLDVAQLEALLSRTFDIGLDVGRGKEPVALVRLRLARARGWTYIGTGSHVKAGSGRSAGVSGRGWVGR